MPAGAPARLPVGSSPLLLVVVDTEEEFDWGRPFDRNAVAVRAMERQHLAQEIFDRFRVRPCYAVDYPVVARAGPCAALRQWADEGRAEIGAHLHPWVSPPFEEEVSPANSFPGNLPRRLEAAKLARLGQQIEETLGRRPRVYKAGRYGFGPNTAGILQEQGFLVDLSHSPPFDYRAEGGPDFSRLSCEPFWIGEPRRVLAIPNTGAWVGWLGGAAGAAYGWASRPLPGRLRAPGLLARLRAVERLRLSPEGFSFAELRRLTASLLGRGVRVFTFSYHSPSLLPGSTPYVRSGGDLARFLDRLRRYLDYFLGEVGGAAVTPLEVRHRLAGAEEAA